MNGVIDNCLFCPTDSYVYGQINESDVENTLTYLRGRFPEYAWRVDKNKYVYVALPNLRKYGGCEFNNPNTLWKNNVWITFAPMGSTCYVNGDGKVVVDTGVYNLYNGFVTGLQF